MSLKPSLHDRAPFEPFDTDDEQNVVINGHPDTSVLASPGLAPQGVQINGATKVEALCTSIVCQCLVAKTPLIVGWVLLYRLHFRERLEAMGVVLVHLNLLMRLRCCDISHSSSLQIPD